MSDACEQCGACCRELIVEAHALDVARQPEIAERGQACRDNADLPPESHSWILAVGSAQPCPFVRPDNRCEIYPTRPNDCVAIPAGGEQCQEARRSQAERLAQRIVKAAGREILEEAPW